MNNEFDKIKIFIPCPRDIQLKKLLKTKLSPIERIQADVEALETALECKKGFLLNNEIVKPGFIDWLATDLTTQELVDLNVEMIVRKQIDDAINGKSASARNAAAKFLIALSSDKPTQELNLTSTIRQIKDLDEDEIKQKIKENLEVINLNNEN